MTSQARDPLRTALPMPSRYLEFATIRQLPIPEIEFRIPGLLPVGLTVLISPPKIGKTILGQQIEHNVSRGVPLFDHKPDHLYDCLAVDLEGGARRTKQRSLLLHPSTQDDPDGARDVIYVHGTDAGYQAAHSWQEKIVWLGVELDAARAMGRDVAHIRIDTLRLFLGAKPRDANAYDFDAIVGRALDEFAHQRNVSLLVAHHTRKGSESDDWLERVSGSTGIAGSASAIWLLDRARGADTGVLYATLRDGPESEHPVRYAGMRWSFAEDMTVAQAKHQQGGQPRAVLDLLTVRAVPLSFDQLRDGTGIDDKSLGKVLDRLRQAGEIESAAGRWRLVEQPQLQPQPQDFPLSSGGEAETDRAGGEDSSVADVDGDQGDDGRQANVAIPQLVDSVRAVKAMTVRIIAKDQREGEPWSTAERWQVGRHRWVDASTADQLASDGGWDAVVLDRRAAYPSVMSSVPVATSTLAHTGAAEYDPRRAGVYLVNVPDWPVPGRPHPLGVTGERPGAQWVTTPHMELFTRRGVPVEIVDSWTGYRSSAVFERFYRWAREAREAATAQGPEAAAEAKRQTNVAIRSLWPRSSDRGRLWRPDWYVSVVAEANVRHWVKADAALADGLRVVALRQTDEAVVAIPSDTPDDAQSVAAAVLPYSVQPDGDTGAGYGQVHVKARLSLSDWLAWGYRTEAPNRGDAQR